jgi:hypothetical protein
MINSSMIAMRVNMSATASVATSQYAKIITPPFEDMEAAGAASA